MTPTPEEARALAERLTGYTPGPWRISYERGSSHLRSADNTSLMCDETYYPWVPETEGDWEIIAAAPDLHAALTAMVDEVERLRLANSILRAEKSGGVWVCPKCDIARCRHYRAALKGDDR